MLFSSMIRTSSRALSFVLAFLVFCFIFIKSIFNTNLNEALEQVFTNLGPIFLFLLLALILLLFIAGSNRLSLPTNKTNGKFGPKPLYNLPTAFQP